VSANSKTAITGAILAAAFAAGISGAAMAEQKTQNQAGGTTAPNSVAAPDDDSTSANTAATIHAVNTYLLWKKHCTNNLLPRCEK
jgi:hypothetical protein